MRTKLRIADRLLEERQRLGLSQTEAAKAGDVAFRTYQNYESGERHPNAETLANLFVAGFDVLYILTGGRNSSTLSNEDSALLAEFHKAEERMRTATLTMLKAYNSSLE